MPVGSISSRVVDRTTRRELERNSRLRRAANLQRMRQMHHALERTMLVFHTFDEPVWQRLFGADAIQMRGILKLSKEARSLQIEQAELRRVLREYQLSSEVMSGMLTHLTLSDWDWNVMRWRKLARTHFQPWTLAAYQQESEKAVKAAHAFKWRTDLQTSRVSFFGWHDLRRIDPVEGDFQFEFVKSFHGYDIMDYVNTMWDTYEINYANQWMMEVFGCVLRSATRTSG